MEVRIIKVCLIYQIMLPVYGKLMFSYLDPMPLNGIEHRECQVKGKLGVCMFSWECRNIGGSFLGICQEGYLFGGCCGSPPIVNPLSSFITINKKNLYPLEKRKKKRECGKSLLTEEFDSRIVNGIDTKLGEFPWQASLRIVTPFPMTIAWCGAVVLNERWVITAAHCAQGLKTENLVVRYGSHNVYDSTEASPIQERQAIDIVFHPEFDQLSKGHDIALIKVNEPVKFDNFVTPICLPGLYVGNLIGAKAIVSGWGKGESDEDFPMVLQKAMVPILKNADCERMYTEEGKRIQIRKHMLCAGYKEGRIDSCQGDSGGPLQVRGDDGRWFLAGVTSSGFKCAKPNLPGLYTRASLYVPWILEHIKQ
ncbi:UNVERIFIED_CONTAM: hypothetical protein RMT77_004668 [Armadillidium vulgare]